MRVLCAGHVNWDVTLRVDRLPDPDGEVLIEERVQAGGGSAANVACTLASLDVTASLFGSVGEDQTGRLVCEELDAFGVDTANIVRVAGHETSTKYLVVDGTGEVMVLSNAGANEAFAPDDLDTTTLAAADHLHLTSQRPATAAALAELADERGIVVSFDPGRRIADRDYAATLANTDVLFLNEREAATLSERESFADLVSEATVVVKHGGQGATVHRPGRELDHPGYPVEAVDTTGAGDAFAAGYIAARWRLFDGVVPGNQSDDAYREVLAAANACGALASLRVGARTAPTWADVEGFVADHGVVGE
ncbi:carbohydrate kinase family protein [Halomarina litorea]|uniref:carbohydrate kinase family protein n=1 Tax=Halomarina litorea TaxID=2961595 RepID=UPI0020C32AE6|nr:PfkB family carbohydrate kinase [Halomarina sp. BCD28]